MGRLAFAGGKRPVTINLSKLQDGALPRLAAFAYALQAHLWLMATMLDNEDARAYRDLVQWASAQSLAPAEGYDRDWQIKRQLVYIRILMTLSEKQRIAPRYDLSLYIPLLDEMQTTYTAQGWVDRVIEILIVKALVLDAVGKTRAGSRSLDLGPETAEPRRYVRMFLDEGKRMQHLLYECVRRMRPHLFTQRGF